jgi:hypothetical protein
MRATHIIDWKTTHPMSGQARTLCGRETARVLGIALGAIVASNPHAATCRKCRAKRDGRSASW